MSATKSDSGMTLDVEPKGLIYSNTAFKVSLRLLMHSYLEKAHFSVYIVGIEKHGKDKVSKHKFFKQVVDTRVIFILPNTLINYSYPCAIDKPLPSSFEYTDLKQHVKGSIHYEVRAKIKTKDNKRLVKKFVVIRYCSYANYELVNTFSKQLLNEKIRFDIELDKEMYRADERILCKCKITKRVWDMCTGLSKAVVRCKLRQVLTIRESVLHFFNRSNEYTKDLLEIQYTAKGRPEYLDQNTVEFPIYIDLKVTSLAVAIEGSTKGEHLENSYSLLFDLRLEDAGERAEFVIPLLITAT